jgi:dTDP-4-amino-4,6-dideoxygalactose transaminase
VIPIARPVLETAEAEAAARVILSGWVSQGPQVAEFEREFAAFVGAAHACAVSNCTTALHLALAVGGIGPGDEVITASHTFIATANCIRYVGAVPVFVDIDPQTFNIDPAGVAAAITSRTRAIIAVHQMGMPCDLAALQALARRHHLLLIEDAACAAGSEIQVDGEWERVGRTRGDITCFSFHPRKVITTGEGGMLTTNNDAFDAQFRLLRQHGMSVSDAARHGSPKVIFEDYLAVGFNYRMTDMQAAIGRCQIERLPGIVARRRALARGYARLLVDVDGLQLPEEPIWARSNWQSYCVRLPDHVDQAPVMQKLLERGIATRRGIMCVHREAPYRASLRPSLVHSERAQDRCVLLPLYAQMTDADQTFIADAVRSELRSVRLASPKRSAAGS